MKYISLSKTKIFCWGMLASASALTAHAQLPAPLAYYDFEGDAGTTLTDKSGNDYNGDIVGSVTFGEGAPEGSTPGAGGQFSLAGNGHVDVTGFDWFELVHNAGDGDYTLSCWLKPDEAALSGDKFIWGQTSEGVHNGVRGSGTLHTAHWGADSNASTPLEADVWVHAIWTYNGADDLANIYLNGENDLQDFSQRAPNGSGSLILGGRNGGGENFNGSLDDMAIWAEVLDADAIALLAGGASPINVGAVDSDADGMLDSYEEKNELEIGANDSALDKDGDGLTNKEEHDGTEDADGKKIRPQTFANDPDSDDDGLSDKIESNTGVFVSIAGDTGTHPRKDDTDSDGLKDGAETKTGTFVSRTDTGTDPHNKDTDGDGASDGTEVALGSNPFDPADAGDVLISNGDWAVTHVFEAGTINDAVQAQEAIDSGEGEVFKGPSRYIHFHDNVAPPIYVDESLPYPLFNEDNGGDGFGDRNDFAIEAKGMINAAAAGIYTFVCNSDDGFVLTIDDEVVGQAGNRGRSNTFMEVELTAGLHKVSFIHWERGGGAGVTLAHARELGGVSSLSEDDFVLTRPFVDISDSDGDGMTDLYETANELNPEVNDAAADKDNDSLTNLQEFQKNTRANLADTDGDGLNDGVETDTGTYVNASNTGTDPLKSDTDNDDLKDGVETKTGIFVSATNTGTDPFKDDSDGDGRKDGREVESGTNPLDAGDPPPPDPSSVVSGYWPLDADLKDASGNGGDGELKDGDDDIPDFVEGKLGTALSLDGIAEYVEINPDLEDLYSGYNEDGEPNPDGFSVSAWFKVGLWDKTWQCLVAKGEGNRWRVHRRGGETVITGNGGNGDVPNNRTVEPEDDEWHFLVLTSNPELDEAKLWVDGQLEGENTGLNLEDNSMPMMIGENPDARNRTWNGLVDDVAFFKKSLTEEEVLMLWNDGEGASVAQVFLGGGTPLGFRITNVEYLTSVGGAAAQLRVTWASRDGSTYAVDQSQTIPDNADGWEEVADGVDSGGEATSFTIPVPAGANQLYVRVRQE